MINKINIGGAEINKEVREVLSEEAMSFDLEVVYWYVEDGQIKARMRVVILWNGIEVRRSDLIAPDDNIEDSINNILEEIILFKKSIEIVKDYIGSLENRLRAVIP